MRRACLLVLLALPALAPAAHAVDAAGLRKSLARHHSSLGSSAGARVVDLDSGRVLFARRDERALVPASNEKLFVSASALLRFGPDHAFATTVHAGGEIDDDGVLRGDLLLVGGGDPALDDLDLGVLVRAVRDAGVKRISGGVVGDEARFDARRGSYDSGFAYDHDLGGVLGALVWGHGRAGSKGPAQYAAGRLHSLLKAAGVTLGRKPRSGLAPRPVPDALGTAPSPPVSTLTSIINGPSENWFAEMMVKSLGAAYRETGSTSAGLAVVREDMATFGIHPRLLDGSGLSRANRTTARQVLRLLERMNGQEVAATWNASLPVAGRSGTLRKRMRGTPAAGACRAKTGTLIGVSALSGYCTTRDGSTVAFSFIENGVYAPRAKRIEDRMVAAIARYEQ